MHFHIASKIFLSLASGEFKTIKVDFQQFRRWLISGTARHHANAVCGVCASWKNFTKEIRTGLWPFIQK